MFILTITLLFIIFYITKKVNIERALQPLFIGRLLLTNHGDIGIFSLIAGVFGGFSKNISNNTFFSLKYNIIFFILLFLFFIIYFIPTNVTSKFLYTPYSDPATPVAEGIFSFHHLVFYYLLVIVVFVSWFLVRILYTATVISSINAFNNDDVDFDADAEEIYSFNIRVDDFESLEYSLVDRRSFVCTETFAPHNYENPYLEFLWTLVPTLILFSIAAPSLTLLYAMNELLSPSITIKITGWQWYWIYEINDSIL